MFNPFRRQSKVAHRAKHSAEDPNREIVDPTYMPSNYRVQWPNLWARRLSNYAAGIIVRFEYRKSARDHVEEWATSMWRQREIRRIIEQSENWGWVNLPYQEWSQVWPAAG